MNRFTVRLLIGLVLAVALPAPAVRAEEGMWQPRQIPELAPELKAAGMELDPARLGEVLRQLVVATPQNATAPVDDEGGAARGALVQGEDAGQGTTAGRTPSAGSRRSAPPSRG